MRTTFVGGGDPLVPFESFLIIRFSLSGTAFDGGDRLGRPIIFSLKHICYSSIRVFS
jgi:hypothetical protein